MAGLISAGFQAFLVGGGVRDLLLERNPIDFDVATNATPTQISSIFRRSRLIGRRFKLVHVRENSELIEVATFRKSPEPLMVRIRQGLFSEIMILAGLKMMLFAEIILLMLFI